MVLDLSNWEQSTSSARVYNKDASLPVGSTIQGNALRRPGSSGPVKQKLRIETNIDTGDYKVFATGVKQLGLDGNAFGQDIEIYSYDSSTNKKTIRNEKYYDDVITSDVNEKGSRSKGSKAFNSDIRIDTFNLARTNQDTKANANSFKKLSKQKGYLSAANQAVVPPQSRAAEPPVVGGVSATRETPNASISLDGAPEGSRIKNDPEFGEILVIPFEETDDSGDGGNVDEVKTTKVELFKYPLGEIPDLGYDFIQITSFDYVPVGLPFGYGADADVVTSESIFGTDAEGKKTITTANNKRRKRNQSRSRLFTNRGNTISLPMVGSITESSAVQWSDDTVSEIQNIAAGIAYGSITGSSDPLKALMTAGGQAVASVQKAITGTDAQSMAVKRAIVAYFAGQAASVPNILQRVSGKMINNNLELLFNGPTLRSFNFNFQLRPRSKGEAFVIRNIIRSLKKDSAPERSPDFMFLETPKIFMIKYIYNNTNEEHPFMNRIKPCALTGLTVNYTPDGSYMTYEEGGSMTGYDLSLSFKEIEPVYRDDQEKSLGMGF